MSRNGHNVLNARLGWTNSMKTVEVVIREILSLWYTIQNVCGKVIFCRFPIELTA